MGFLRKPSSRLGKQSPKRELDVFDGEVYWATYIIFVLHSGNILLKDSRLKSELLPVV